MLVAMGHGPVMTVSDRMGVEEHRNWDDVDYSTF